MRILNTVLLLAVLGMNYLANALPINGKSTAALSDQYPNLFVPAGLTFAIWGLIYLLLIIYVVAGWLNRNESGVINSWLFAISCVFNASWIIAWHYEQVVLSLLIMAGLLLSLTGINRLAVREDRELARATFGVYLGWICIAIIANFTALLVHFGWTGGGISQESWTIVMIGVGTLVAMYAMYALGNFYLALPVIWAFYGISLKRAMDFLSIVHTAQIAMVAVAGFVVVYLAVRRRITHS